MKTRFSAVVSSTAVEKNRRSAMDCCRRCRSDFYRRRGDLLAEQGESLEALEAFNRCLAEGHDLSGDALGRALMKDGLPREIVAGVIDLCQLKCRPTNLREDNLLSARRWIERCLDKRDDLSAEHRAGLAKILEVFDSNPAEIFDRLEDLRQSFIAPVPGLLGERLGSESKETM